MLREEIHFSFAYFRAWKSSISSSGLCRCDVVPKAPKNSASINHRPYGPPHGKERSNGERKETTPGPTCQSPIPPHHNPAAFAPKTLINPSSPSLSPPLAPKPFPPSLSRRHYSLPNTHPHHHEATQRRRRFPWTQRRPRWPLRWWRPRTRRRRGPLRRRWRVPRRGPSGRGRRCVVSPDPQVSRAFRAPCSRSR